MSGGALARFATLVSLTTLVLCNQTTFAQDDSQEASARAAARVLFQEGVALIDQEDWPQAENRFSRALELTESPVGRFNLGHVLQELGRLVEAADQLRRVLMNAGAPDAVRDAARERLARLEPRFARLTVQVSGATDVELTRNGEPVPEATYGVASPVDPGTHVVAVRRGHTTLEEQTVTLAEGESGEASFAVTPAVGLVTDDGRIGPRHVEIVEIYEEWWFWTIVGVVGVGAALGITLGLTLTSESPCAGDFVPCRLDLP